MDIDEKRQLGLIIGGIIGAVLGAGIAYLLMTTPANLEEGEKPNPLTGSELLSLTSAAALLLRKLDDIRRRT